MTKVEQQLLTVIGILALLLGGYVITGWLLVNPAMVRIIPDSTVMVLNTALCFIVSGVWFVLRPAAVFHPGAFNRAFSVFAGVFLILISVTVLVEIFTHFDLGIDQVLLHAQILDRNPTPGRMAPNTCLGFLCLGIAFLVAITDPSRLQRRCLYGLGALVALVGLSSLLSYAMELDWLYAFVNTNRMAMPTSAGLAVLGIGVLTVGQSASPETSAAANRQDIRITRIAAVVMIMLALASGLAGFVVLKQGTDRALQDEILQKARDSAETYTSVIDRQLLQKNALLSFPVFEKDLQTLPLNPDDADSRDHLGRVTRVMTDLGFVGIELRDAQGKAVFTQGALVEHPEQSFLLKNPEQIVRLIYSGGYLLHAEKPIVKDGAVIGSFVTEQKLRGLDRMFSQLQHAGKTTDAGLCQRADDKFNCFPSRFVAHAVNVDMFKDGRPSYPMAHALLGETGTIYANDIRGISVLAAFTPIPDSDLGIVVKVDTVEFYGFVREKLHILLAILAVFVAAGTYILRFQLQPLATRLVTSERKMRNANDVLAEDTERLNRIVAVQNRIALSPFDIATTLQIIVDNVQVLTRAAGAAIEMIDGEELYYRATSGSFAHFTGFRLRISGSLSGCCIEAREIMRCDDAETDPRADRVATRKLNIRSMIVAPLLYDGNVIGVLKTAAVEPNAFNIKDEQALQLLSSLIGSAISHQTDYEAKQKLLGEKIDALDALEKTTDTLRLSEERTRIVIESAYDAFIAMDENGRITDWNVQAEKVLGWSRDEAFGKLMIDLVVAPTFRPVFAERMAMVLSPAYRAEENLRLEINVIRHTGEEFPVEMTMSPIRTDHVVLLTAFLHDITERKQHQEKLTQLAQYDALTGLPNRSLFMDRLGVAALRLERTHRAMGLMFLDLDGFKKINDGYGHHVGDGLLKIFAERLTAIVRKTDTVARLAGDEFTIILENLADPENDARMIAAKIIEATALPFDIAGERIHVTTSVGIVIARAGGNTIDGLIKLADAEMYKAKNKGKNQFSLISA